MSLASQKTQAKVFPANQNRFDFFVAGFSLADFFLLNRFVSGGLIHDFSVQKTLQIA